jgi:hypothetical protein
MAQDSQAARKAQLIAQLSKERSELAHAVKSLRQDLDVSSHLKHSFFQQKAFWLAGAGITGWVLSRLPSRKKPATEMVNGTISRGKEGSRGAWVISLLGMLLPLIKPAVTAFLTQKLTEFNAKGGFNNLATFSRR